MRAKNLDLEKIQKQAEKYCMHLVRVPDSYLCSIFLQIFLKVESLYLRLHLVQLLILTSIILSLYELSVV